MDDNAIYYHLMHYLSIKNHLIKQKTFHSKDGKPSPRISRTSKAAVKSHFNFYTCMLHKGRKNNTGEMGWAWRVECNNSKSHNHFLSIELYGDRYSRRDGLCGGHPLAVREACLEHTDARVCVCDAGDTKTFL